VRLRKAQLNLLIFLSILFLSLGYPSLAYSEESPRISFVMGNAFAVSKNQPDKLKKLEQSQNIGVEIPYSVVTSKESFLEISQLSNEYPFTVRLGQSTALEVRDSSKFFLFKGSILLADKGHHSWFIESNTSQISMIGSGTYIVESTSLGFKLIILEGEFELDNQAGRNSLSSGDLALIIGKESGISQGLQIELPLILSTSRLINFFPNELPTHLRLLSAAQVQVLRMKTKYDAFIGGVSQDKKLRVWKVGTTKSDKTP